MRIILTIFLCFVVLTAFAQVQRTDTSLNFSIKLINVTKHYKLDTIDYVGQVFIQLNQDTLASCQYSKSTLTVDKKIWKELRVGRSSKVDSAFLFIEESNNSHSFIKIPYQPGNTDCPCLLEIKSFFDEPNVFDCSYWARLDYMGTVYFAKGVKIFNRDH